MAEKTKLTFAERLAALVDRAASRWLDWRTEQAYRDNPLTQMELKRLSVEDGFFEGTFVTPAVALLAQECARMLEAANAKNYIQFDMQPRLDRALKPIRVTVAWASGESPATKAARLETELETSRQRVAELEQFTSALREDGDRPVDLWPADLVKASGLMEAAIAGAKWAEASGQPQNVVLVLEKLKAQFEQFGL